MNAQTRRRINQTIASVVLFCMATQTTFAALLNFAQAPLFIGANIPPKVMLTLSKDQQLYKKAYNDYTDLDGDGVMETTYKHTVTYYGYFDPAKCYSYVAGNSRFEPQSVYKDGTGKPIPALCSGQWSGNFLNWVSMSRMDAVRKLLYGGTRVVDTTADTVLERAFLPNDAHAWAKYYNPAGGLAAEQPPINQLTPFSAASVPTVPTSFTATTSAPYNLTKVTADVDIDFTSDMSSRMALGDQVCMQKSGVTGVCNVNNPVPADAFFMGAVMAISNGGKTVRFRLNVAGVIGTGASSTWTVTNFSNVGISFCNLTLGSSSGANSRSSTNTNLPLIRVAKGNFGMWNANERWQCQWFAERNNLQASFSGVRSNGNQAALSEINASAENPQQTVNGLGTGSAQGEYYARVLACVTVAGSTALHGTERCKQYPNGNYKPVGLLQTYGDEQRIHFGLMTGSYQKNISGGVLRKNTDTFVDEVNVGTNGAFKATQGIVTTLDNMRIYGYNYGDGTYLSGGGDNCDYQLTSITEGRCTSWGNPMSEVFFEAVRYFAGQAPTAAYQYTVSGSKDNELGLPLVAAANWKDPISQATFCAPLNVLVFNASVSTNDDDLRTTSAAAINSSSDIGTLTTNVGKNEPLSGAYFVGKINGVSNPTDPDFELCTPKSASGSVPLGDASGICPEGPTLSGSYLLAGVAHHARTNPIRKDITLPATDQKSLKVTSYGIQLATNVPQINILVPGGGGRAVTIQPIYRLDLGTTFGGGALVDMKFVRQQTVGSVSTGKVYITWEDSEQGGDYDQDMWGTLEWRLDASTGSVAITTNAVSASTINPQGFGYTISGTTQDGPHFHSGILGFMFPKGAVTPGVESSGVLGCNNCQAASEIIGQRGPTTYTYTLGSTVAGTLKDPLWYLAKYGGYNDINGDGMPSDPGEWDTKNNFTGADTPDLDPDNYFLVTNPIQLEAALDKIFAAINLKASASSVSSNSTSLKTGSAIYNARFDSGDWSGDLRAFLIGMDGSIAPNPAWEAASKLPAPDARVILSYNTALSSRKGVAFRWPANPASPTAAEIGTPMISNLNLDPDTNLPDGRGKERLAYLRGDDSQEGVVTTAFRVRKQGKLGDIVNSNPAFVADVPNDVNLDASYQTFRLGFAAKPRTPMVYVGANDGMLHGFDATPDPSGGTEKFAYVPSKVASKLNQLTKKTYVHRYYVDGSADVADAQISGVWKSVLVGGLAAGGQGIYALDVTDPSAFAEGNNKTVLWEFNDTDDIPGSGYLGYGLGYVFGQPVIRKMSNGKWAAIVSGGYNNSEADSFAGDGHAYLYVIFLDGPSGANRTWIRGTDYIRIDTGVGTVATPNGLAPPFAADVDADGLVDFVYAGDLQGNFWKFDLRDGKTPGNWASSSNRVRMFIAKSSTGVAQPITGRAEGTPHPSGQGFVITFGTGKYIEPTDTVGPYRSDSFYGVWDKNDKATNIATQSTRDIQRSKLFEQSIVVSGVFRSVQPKAVTPTGGPDWSTDWGWFMDFPSGTTTGERSVFKPLLIAGRLIFTTLIPSGGACEFGGTSFLMVVSPTTGGSVNAAVLDLNGDKQLNTADMLSPGVYASGVQSAVGITPTPTVIAGRSIQSSGSTPGSAILGTTGPLLQGFGSLLGYMIIAGSNGNMNSSVVGLSNNSGRVSWREILKD